MQMQYAAQALKWLAGRTHELSVADVQFVLDMFGMDRKEAGRRQTRRGSKRARSSATLSVMKSGVSLAASQTSFVQHSTGKSQPVC